MALTLQPEPLSAEAFAPFGDVIEAGGDYLSINFGRTERYHELAAPDTSAQDGHAGISIFRSQPMELPATVKMMERHPLGSQAFISMQRRPFLVLVAPPTYNEQPDLSQLRLFRVGSDQGVNYHRGVWHHYSFSLDEPCDFLCIDRCGGNGKNCDEYYFNDEVMISA